MKNEHTYAVYLIVHHLGSDNLNQKERGLIQSIIKFFVVFIYFGAYTHNLN